MGIRGVSNPTLRMVFRGLVDCVGLELMFYSWVGLGSDLYIVFSTHVT
jgi:hypothetical protein